MPNSDWILGDGGDSTGHDGIPLMTNLPGLTGVVNQICLSFDGRSSAITPYGVLVIEK